MTSPIETSSELQKSLHARHVSMIAIGGIIGAGLFVGSSTAIAAAGPAIIVSYALAGLIILMIMRMLSEMAVVSPGVGSFTEIVRIGLGDAAGFVSGWLYWYFWVIVVAIEAIAGAVILHQWIDMPVWLLGALLLAAMTGVNLLSTKSYGEFEFWLSTTKVAAILIFILLAGLWAFGITAPNGNSFGNLTDQGGFAPRGWAAVLAGVTSVIFALCGAEIATIAAAESREPAKTIARMTGSVALRIILFYIVSITLIVSVVPWTQITPGQSPFAATLDYIGIAGAATIMQAVVLVAVSSCLNSGMYVTSRILFVLADHDDAPKALVGLTARKVPARAIIIASIFGYVALAASVISPEVVFSFLVNASGAIMLIIYAMVCLAQIKGRRQAEQQTPHLLSIKMWWFPYASYATIAAIFVVLIGMTFDDSMRSQLFASIGLTVLFALIFLVRRRHRLAR